MILFYTALGKLYILILLFLLSINLFSQDKIEKIAAAPVVIPEGFVIEDAFPTETFDLPVQIAFLPDGNKLVAEKSGLVWLLDNSNEKNPVPFADLTAKVLNERDRGLLSLALDPDFSENKWIYFLYVADPDSDDDDNDYKEAWSRVERYQVNDNFDAIDPQTSQILIGRDWADGIPFITAEGSHSIGTIRFAEDKSMLVSAGDAADWGPTDIGGNNPPAFQPGKHDPIHDMGAFRSQSLNSLCGKIIRVNKETGEGLFSNPFWDGNPNSVRSKVWSYGLRNPFRFSIKPESGDSVFPGVIFIGDVGWDNYEELNISKTGGENFGWPKREAWAFTSYNLVDSAFNGNTNVITPGNFENPNKYTYPTYWWKHSGGADSYPVGWTGKSSITGSFYTGSTYPAEYKNTLFLMDFASKWIRALTINEVDSITGYSDFITDAAGPVNMEAEPFTGDLFLVTHDDEKIWRITYPTGNYNPVIVAEINPLFGDPPLMVNADASSSYDPDSGDVLSFDWDLGNGDHIFTSAFQYTYNTSNIYDVKLTLTDNNGGTAVKVFKVYVGIELPQAEILTPEDSAFFDLDENISFTASDVPSADYEWRFDFVHNDHIHPAQTLLEGKNVNYIAEIPHGEPGNHYHWRVRMTVTKDELSNTDTIDIFPKQNLVTDTIWFTPSIPLPGLDFTTHVKVSNPGQVSSVITDYKAYKGDAEEYDGSIEALSENGSTIIDIPMGTFDNLNYLIKFHADYSSLIYETDETDNILVRNAGIVPVELISFNAQVKNNEVILKWVTAAETNNSGFEIYKKSEVRNQNAEWERIGFVPGYGTSSERKSYSYTDKLEGFNTKILYRLKQIDYNGTFEYSDIIVAKIEVPVEFNLSQNYPNPFNPVTSITFAIPVESEVSLTVYNLLGNKIAEIVNEKRGAGFYTEEFNASDIASGIYFYILKAGEFQDIKKLIVLK